MQTFNFKNMYCQIYVFNMGSVIFRNNVIWKHEERNISSKQLPRATSEYSLSVLKVAHGLSRHVDAWKYSTDLIFIKPD